MLASSALIMQRLLMKVTKSWEQTSCLQLELVTSYKHLSSRNFQVSFCYQLCDTKWVWEKWLIYFLKMLAWVTRAFIDKEGCGQSHLHSPSLGPVFTADLWVPPLQPISERSSEICRTEEACKDYCLLTRSLYNQNLLIMYVYSTWYCVI